MPRRPSRRLDDDRSVVLRELRRSRRYLTALLAGLSEADMEQAPRRPRGACIKWHVGHVAFLERQLLSTLVGGLRTDLPERHLRFGPAAKHDLSEEFPLWPEVERSLQSARRLTEALLDNVTLDDRSLEVFREIVNADYAQARYVRQRRREMGRPDVADPRGRLVLVDTDCEAPPRFHVDSWETPPPARPAAVEGAEVVSMEDRRHARAAAALERGHALVGRGDVTAALRAFEEAGSLEASAEALTYQAWMHSLLGDVDLAERLCLQAIDLDPDFGNPYNDLGTLRLQRRDVSAAIAWFERAKRARRYEPRHYPFLNLGRLYLSMGRRDKALAEFEGALAHAPHDADIRDAIERLRNDADS